MRVLILNAVSETPLQQSYSYEAMLLLDSVEMNKRLIALKCAIEQRIAMAIKPIAEGGYENTGALDLRFLQRQKVLNAFDVTVERVLKELRDLGHKISYVERDLSNNMEDCQIEASSGQGDNIQGLWIQFYPHRTVVTWCVTGF